MRPSHRRPAPLRRFWFGAAHYPEHSTPAERARDAERMAAAGMNVVRMAEFAWDLIEPEPGAYDFSLFDATIADLARHGVATILCTPTATPPRWLTHAHPDVLRVDADGRRMAHGNRQHVCTTNETFRAHSRAITGAMVAHFAGNPHVVGWQTDNELNAHFSDCCCAACLDAFQRWLRERYGDVDALNEAWGTRFWSQSYRSFDEVVLPFPNRPAPWNPSQRLDYSRFLAAAVARFQAEQVEIFRRHDPERRWFVTHNVGLFRHLDARGAFGEPLDVLAHDVYPMFADPRQRAWLNAYLLDWARGWSGNVIVPEHQAGAGGQVQFLSDTPEPGEVRRMSWTTIAHGADSLLYFRWRTARYGAEQFWVGLLGEDDVPGRRYEEAALVGREIAAVAPHVLGTSVFVDVAIAGCDLLNIDAHEALPLGLPGPVDTARQVHAVLHDARLACGFVHPEDDLDGIGTYIVPSWPVIDPRWIPRLDAWVRAGGRLIVGGRTGTHDLRNHLLATPALRALTGVRIAEWGKQSAPDQRPLSIDGVATGEWYEAYDADADVEVLAHWEGRHLTGAPAITRRPLGAGDVIAIGTYVSVPRVATALLLPLVKASPPWPGLPDGVHATRRDGASHSLWIARNHGDAAVSLDVPAGEVLVGGAELAPNGVLVLRVERAK